MTVPSKDKQIPWRYTSCHPAWRNTPHSSIIVFRRFIPSLCGAIRTEIAWEINDHSPWHIANRFLKTKVMWMPETPYRHSWRGLWSGWLLYAQAMMTSKLLLHSIIRPYSFIPGEGGESLGWLKNGQLKAAVPGLMNVTRRPAENEWLLWINGVVFMTMRRECQVMHPSSTVSFLTLSWLTTPFKPPVALFLISLRPAVVILKNSELALVGKWRNYLQSSSVTSEIRVGVDLVPLGAGDRIHRAVCAEHPGKYLKVWKHIKSLSPTQITTC